VKADPFAGLDVGKAGVLVEEQGQFGPLAELEADGTATGGLSDLLKEVGGKGGAKRRWRAGHGEDPGKPRFARTTCCPSAYFPTIARQPLSYLGNGPLSRKRLKEETIMVKQNEDGAEALLAELAAAAYGVALRHGIKGPFIDVELDLWRELRAVLGRGTEAPPCPE
jgi:hypothetical protein